MRFLNPVTPLDRTTIRAGPHFATPDADEIYGRCNSFAHGNDSFRVCLHVKKGKNRIQILIFRSSLWENSNKKEKYNIFHIFYLPFEKYKDMVFMIFAHIAYEHISFFILPTSILPVYFLPSNQPVYALEVSIAASCLKRSR